MKFFFIKQLPTVVTAVMITGMSTVIPEVDAVRCGKWFSYPCLSETDKRYDPNSSNALKDQNPVWGKLEGHWVGIQHEYDMTGYPKQPGPLPDGLPYESFPFKIFSRYVLDGSRFTWNIMAVYPPVNTSNHEDFCDSLSSDENVIGNNGQQCGVTGYADYVEMYGIGSYEKDGIMNTISLRGVHDMGTPVELTMDGGRVNNPVDENSIHVSTRGASWEIAPDYFVDYLYSSTYVFLDDNGTDLSITDSFFIFPRVASELPESSNVRLKKMSHDEWAKEINNAFDEYNVLPIDQPEFEPLPEAGCLVPPCPTEDQWCEYDPDCSESPYQEPPGHLKAGPIIGIIVGVGVFLFIAGYAWYQHRMRQLKVRFVRNVARNITITPTPGALSQDQLLKEFNHIVNNNGKTIGKEELKEWLNDGKLGAMSVSDFDALWAAMDIDETGHVDFIEFCTFLSGCGEAFDEVYKEQETMSAGEKMQLASRRLSAISTTKSFQSTTFVPVLGGLSEEIAEELSEEEEEGRSSIVYRKITNVKSKEVPDDKKEGNEFKVYRKVTNTLRETI